MLHSIKKAPSHDGIKDERQFQSKSGPDIRETGGACGLVQLIAKVFEWNAAPVCAWVDGWVHRCGEKQGMQRRCARGLVGGFTGAPWAPSQRLGLPVSSPSHGADPPRSSGRWGGQLIH